MTICSKAPCVKGYVIHGLQALVMANERVGNFVTVWSRMLNAAVEVSRLRTRNSGSLGGLVLFLQPSNPGLSDLTPGTEQTHKQIARC